ncbi:IDEAL domain-containing protein [Caldifermentibacillus hisashii]|uniref:IDEAL domain-containing protein n=1 Tax=Caldifermentibacillus hisashii TaxID=996558 RepID=UPI003100F23E
MKRENSFAELTKASLENTQQKDKFIQSVYIDLLIQEALLKEKKRVIKEKIDEAIDQCDRDSFFLLAKQLTEIEEQLNA